MIEILILLIIMSSPLVYLIWADWYVTKGKCEFQSLKNIVRSQKEAIYDRELTKDEISLIRKIQKPKYKSGEI